MKRLSGVVLGWLLALAAAGLFLWSGYFNVAAARPSGKLEESVARFAMNRSIARRASGAKNPIPASAESLRSGLTHYRENCVGCHGAPGVDAAEYGQGLNPPAPDLTLPRVQKRPDYELYWIVANGIRMTGMPAFSPTHSEKEIWEIVAFLRHLEELAPEEERALKAETEEAEHHHGEAATNAQVLSTPAAATAKTPHAHPPGTGPHRD